MKDQDKKHGREEIPTDKTRKDSPNEPVNQDIENKDKDLKLDDELIENGNVDRDITEENDEETSMLEKNNRYAQEMEEEFRKEISVDKEAEAASSEELYLRMKRRILRSFKWREDIIIPFSRELKISPGELEEILMKRLDMSSLEALHPRFESAKYRCTSERIHSDLKLCWLADVMKLLTDDEVENIKRRITSKIVHHDERYEEALEDGRKELVEYLKR